MSGVQGEMVLCLLKNSGLNKKDRSYFVVVVFFFPPFNCRPGHALNPHPHTRYFRGFFEVQKFFDYTISLRKPENPILHSKGTSDSFWTHM